MRTWNHKTDFYPTALDLALAVRGYFLGLGFECETSIAEISRDQGYRLVVKYDAMFDKAVILDKIARELE